MLRFRITVTEQGRPEQTWVLLPDEPSARMQAEEYRRTHRTTRVRVYREQAGEREVVVDLGA